MLEARGPARRLSGSNIAAEILDQRVRHHRPGGAGAPNNERRFPSRYPTGGSCCLPKMGLRRSSPELPFRGSITRPTDSLSTLRSPGRPGPRKTRYRPVRPDLAGRDFHPLGFKASFKRSSLHLHSLAPGFSWRTPSRHHCFLRTMRIEDFPVLERRTAYTCLAEYPAGTGRTLARLGMKSSPVKVNFPSASLTACTPSAT